MTTTVLIEPAIRSRAIQSAFEAGIINKDGYLADFFRSYIHQTRYARWLEAERRSETWVETVDRFMNCIVGILRKRNKFEPSLTDISDVYTAIMCQEVMPSMRCMYSAGPALEKDHTYAYNCSFMVCDSLDCFSECMYKMMCGCGVGYNVQRCYVEKLPPLPEELHEEPIAVYVADSREGWAAAVKTYMGMLFRGVIARLDVSDVRPKGSLLKTSGGRSQGPEPLITYLAQVTEICKRAAGRKLRPLEVHDMMTLVNDAISNGGGRRGALICIFDHDDQEMIDCKTGSFPGNRFNSNNSACWPDDISEAEFDRLFDPLAEHGFGEPGIFNLAALRRFATTAGRRDASKLRGCNPCGEIVLRNCQDCNLSEVIVRSGDNLATLTRKVTIATILGTWQSTLDHFPALRPEWAENAREERLLGVSLSGVYDCYTLGPDNPHLEDTLLALKAVAIDVNKRLAAEIGINQSAAVTTVKPSGTVSLLTGVCYGISPWFSPYFKRGVCISRHEPICQLLIDAGIPNVDHYKDPVNLRVFYFPFKAAEGSPTSLTVSAVEHYRLWRAYKVNWTEHNPSVTINVKKHEWADIKKAVWEDREIIGGLAFFSYDDSSYVQPVLTALSEAEYNELVAQMPTSVPYSELWRYTESVESSETSSAEDDELSTSQAVKKEKSSYEKRMKKITQRGAMELGCSGGVCATADLV